MNWLVFWVTFTGVFVLGQDSLPADKVVAVLRDEVMTRSSWAMQQQPVTITESVCPRSAGGTHDFIRKGITGGQILSILTAPTCNAMG